ncbi:MAG: hypothetical protein ACO29V_04610 [Limnohabitans sp.]
MKRSVPPCPLCGQPRVLSFGKAKCYPCTYARERANTKHRVCIYCGKDSNQTKMRPGRNGCYDCHKEHVRLRYLQTKVIKLCPVCEAKPPLQKHDGMCLDCWEIAEEFDRLAEEAG